MAINIIPEKGGQCSFFCRFPLKSRFLLKFSNKKWVVFDTTQKEIVEMEMKKAVDDYFGCRISYEEAMDSVDKFSAEYSSIIEPFESEIQRLHTSQESFVQAEELMAQGNYAEAESLYLAVIKEDKDYESAVAKAEECYTRKRESVLAEAEAAAADGNYLQGIDVLKQFQEETGGDGDVEARITDMITQYEQYVRDRAFEFVAQRDMESARVLIKESQQLLPDNESFKALEEELKDYYPVKLQDVFLFEENLYGSVEEYPKDIYQNSYTSGIYYYDTYQSDYIHGTFQTAEEKDIYLLNKEYKYFRAAIAPHEKWSQHTNGKSATFIIYGDGTELFKTLIEKETKPVLIDINVTGIEKLEIVFVGGYQGYFLLGDPLLYKK